MTGPPLPARSGSRKSAGVTAARWEGAGGVGVLGAASRQRDRAGSWRLKWAARCVGAIACRGRRLANLPPLMPRLIAIYLDFPTPRAT